MGRVFLTGDKHGRYGDLADQIEIMGITKDDYIVILGDSGLNYYSGRRADGYKKNLNSLGPKFLIVRGNHEARPTGDIEFYCDDVISGAFIREPMFDNIFYMLDGGVYTIAGKSILVIGGAYSVDKEYRLQMQAAGFLDYKWFPDEQLTEEERNNIMDAVVGLGSVDYIFTHTCPSSFIPTDLFLPGIDQSKVDRSMEDFLDDITEYLTFDKWYCGHWHTDRVVDGCMRFLYHNIIRLGEM